MPKKDRVNKELGIRFQNWVEYAKFPHLRRLHAEMPRKPQWGLDLRHIYLCLIESEKGAAAIPHLLESRRLMDLPIEQSTLRSTRRAGKLRQASTVNDCISRVKSSDYRYRPAEISLYRLMARGFSLIALGVAAPLHVEQPRLFSSKR